MKKIVTSIIAALFVGICVLAPSDNAEAQVVMSNRCCDVNGNVRCLMSAYGPIGGGCVCFGQGTGWIC